MVVAHRWTNQTAEERSTNKPDFTSSSTSNPRHSRLVLPPQENRRQQAPSLYRDLLPTSKLLSKESETFPPYLPINRAREFTYEFEKFDAESFQI